MISRSSLHIVIRQLVAGLLSSHSGFSGVIFSVAQSLVFCVVFCRPLFFILSLIFESLWLCWLSFDLRILITPSISFYKDPEWSLGARYQTEFIIFYQLYPRSRDIQNGGSLCCHLFTDLLFVDLFSPWIWM
jgi:hypothetical protein